MTYSDLQELHKLEAKVQRAEAAVESCIEIAAGCEQYFLNHDWTDELLADKQCSLELIESYVADMKRYRIAMNRLRSRLESTVQLVG